MRGLALPSIRVLIGGESSENYLGAIQTWGRRHPICGGLKTPLRRVLVTDFDLCFTPPLPLASDITSRVLPTSLGFTYVILE